MRYLISRNGRFHTRIVVPRRLRETIGRVELSTPLGADRRRALRLLPAAVARIQDRLHQAEIAATKNRRLDTQRPRLLDAEEMARMLY